MKTAITTFAAATALAALAVPSADNYTAVTNDWTAGNYSNVYEWAQVRLAADTNDLAASYVMVEYDTSFSDFTAMSNSVLRMMRASDAATLPEFTNMWQKTRRAWVSYLEDFLPVQNESERAAQQQKARRTGRPMVSAFVLKMIDDAGLWDNSSNSNGEGEE